MYSPLLTWRDVQYLIVYTSNVEALSKGSKKALWTTNAAGLKFNPQYGFGAIDAEAMVTKARYWTNVDPQVEQILSSSFQSG